MTWLLLAAGTAALYALHGAWTKRITEELSRLSAAWGMFAFSFPLLAAYLALEGLPAVAGAFWAALAANLLLYPLAMYLFVSAMREGDLGVTYPLLALTPILVVPVEWTLLGETPGPRGLAGVALVITGVYLLNFRREETSLLAPFAALARDPGARRGLAVAALWGVSGTVDRVAVVHSSAALYGVAITGALTVVGLFALRAAGELGGGGGTGSSPARSGSAAGEQENRGASARCPLSGRALVLLLVQGVLFGLMFVLQMEALDRALAAYVITIKRTGTLLSVLLGWAFFEEGLVGRRLAGAAVVVAGVALVALG